MAYFASRMKQDMPCDVQLRRFPGWYGRSRSRVQALWRALVVRYLSLDLRPSDVFFFMEYLGGRMAGDHRAIALELRARGMTNRIVGLVHLSPQMLCTLYERDYIRSALETVDQVIVFGNSLAGFFTGSGYGAKVRQTFHYVDTDYYRPHADSRQPGDFTVITMGSLGRNREQLREIIEACTDVQFDICMGKAELEPFFTGLSNVRLHRFLTEANLLRLMQRADVSLSVLQDTIGSNVIVTSLACGIPQVVSDVGSIHDYCSAENAIFCRDTGDFIAALRLLKNQPELRKRMGENARRKAEEFSLEKSIRWFRDFFLQEADSQACCPIINNSLPIKR